jgi:DNA-binding NarL/FixJ family response regulator
MHLHLKGLTPTQVKVAECLLEGMSNKEVARRLGRSSRTIEDHRADIYRRLGVKNTIELVLKAYGIKTEAQHVPL